MDADHKPGALDLWGAAHDLESKSLVKARNRMNRICSGKRDAQDVPNLEYY
jgi:hypothetical protein